MSFTQVDNAILKGLKDLTGRELKVLLYIQKQTKGWNRLSAWIPPSMFSEETGIRIDHCVETLNDLEKRDMVHRIKEGKFFKYFPSLPAKQGYLKRKNLPF